jgi:glycosyltransferase involved in cell wall biosynthesis
MSIKWTIGLPCYNNFPEVFFTVQSLRLHHDMSNKEIVVVDNYGDDLLRDFVVKKGNGVVRYVLSNKTQGVSAAKNAVFDVAEGENVLIIDSHILIQRGCFDVDIPENTFVQGIAVGNGFDRYSYQWSPRWNAGMWGVFEWKTESEMPKEPVDIWGMGAGFFACKRNEW